MTAWIADSQAEREVVPLMFRRQPVPDRPMSEFRRHHGAETWSV